jgi:hypothetical protein
MRKRTGVVVGSVILGGAVVITLLGTTLSLASEHSPELKATVKGTAETGQGELPHAYLNLATWPDSMAGEHGTNGGAHPDWVSYGPTTNLEVPAHSEVTVTIDQYDSGGTIFNPYFANVHGTVGGTETINGKTVTGIDPTNVGHTFTLHMFPNSTQPDLFVSVALPAVADDAPNLANGYPKPNVVTFSFVTGGPGQYIWNCEFPCGTEYQSFGGPMSTKGYMSGTLQVG